MPPTQKYRGSQIIFFLIRFVIIYVKLRNKSFFLPFFTSSDFNPVRPDPILEKPNISTNGSPPHNYQDRRFLRTSPEVKSVPKPKIDIDLSEINDEPIEHKTIQKNIEPSKFNHLLHAGNIFQRAVEKVTSKLHETKSDEKPAEDPNMPKKAKNGSKRPLVVPVPDSMISLNGKKNNEVLEDEEITETDESDSEIFASQDQTIPEENLIGKPFLSKFRVYNK